MPSTPPLPSRDNGYASPPGMRLNKLVWDFVFGEIAARLAVVESTASDMQAVIDAGTSQALAQIAANLGPELAAVQTTIDGLNAQITLAQDHVADLLATGVGADNVAESAGRVFVTPAQKAAIGTNTTAIAANAAAIAAIRQVAVIGVAADTALVAGSAYVVTAVANLTLPAAPAQDDAIRILVHTSGAQPVVLRNGNTIMGAAQDLTIDVNDIAITLVYLGTDWRVF